MSNLTPDPFRFPESTHGTKDAVFDFTDDSSTSSVRKVSLSRLKSPPTNLHKRKLEERKSLIEKATKRLTKGQSTSTSTATKTMKVATASETAKQAFSFFDRNDFSPASKHADTASRVQADLQAKKAAAKGNKPQVRKLSPTPSIFSTTAPKPTTPAAKTSPASPVVSSSRRHTRSSGFTPTMELPTPPPRAVQKSSAKGKRKRVIVESPPTTPDTPTRITRSSKPSPTTLVPVEPIASKPKLKPIQSKGKSPSPKKSKKPPHPKPSSALASTPMLSSLTHPSPSKRPAEENQGEASTTRVSLVRAEDLESLDDEFLSEVNPALVKAATSELANRLHPITVPQDVPRGLEDPCHDIRELFERTIVRRENHSALVTGPRGSGKTLCIRHSLRAVCQFNPSAAFKIVELNGIIQTTDQIAIQEIIRQLGVGQLIERRELTSFTEILEAAVGVSETKGRGRRAKSAPPVPVVFLLEEFDQFARRPRQTLLYTLFELLAHSRFAVAVIGTTVRIDAMELLEKRVRSRFSQRQIITQCPTSIVSLQAILQDILALDLSPEASEPLPECPNVIDSRKVLSRGYVPSYWTPAIGSKSEIKQYATMHNKRIQAILKDPIVYAGFLQRSAEDLAPTHAFAILRYALSKMSRSGDPIISVNHFHQAFNFYREEATVGYVEDISVLELCLIIAMKRLTEKRVDPYNFAMVYDEYEKFATTGASGYSQRRWDFYSKAVCMKSLDRLMALELVAFLRASGDKEFRPLRLLLSPQEVRDGLMKYQNCPTVVRQWGLSLMDGFA